MTDDARPEPSDDGASGEPGEDPLFAEVDERDAGDQFADLGAGADDEDDPFDELGPAPAGGEDVTLDDALDDAFDRMDVGETTGESVWEALDEDAAGVGETVGSGVSGTDQGPTTTADRAATGSEHVVDKRAYCQQCPHFSAPPDVACGHEGTTIVEAVGFDEFRVRNCPMVRDDDAGFDADPAFDTDE